MIATLKLDTVSFGTKGQVVIPRRLRKEFEIEDGTKAMETFMAERKREQEL